MTDPQILDDAMGFTPRLAGAMTIRPGGPAQSGAGRRSMEGSLHRSATQESMAASTSGPAWLEMSHDLRAQRAKEVLLQVLHHPLSLLHLVHYSLGCASKCDSSDILARKPCGCLVVSQAGLARKPCGCLVISQAGIAVGCLACLASKHAGMCHAYHCNYGNKLKPC